MPKDEEAAAASGGALTPEPPFTGDERLLLEVVEALRGADNLRERLLTTLQTGTPAVADLAYAVKVRIKEDYKVIDKIKDRRAGRPPDVEPQPGYCITEVTDLVGLRIVTLYRLDVLEVIGTLLDTISADTSSSAPFVPDSVSEVKIYSTNPLGDVQELPQKLMALFGERGLGGVAKVEEKPSNYSSIHILARGRGKYRDGYRDLPIEIQVRTALEDVWGQIEHSLKYKRKKLVGVGKASPESAQLRTTLSHLGALKTMIDGIAQYGDQIKVQIDQLEPSLRYSDVKTAEETDVRLSKLDDLPPAIRDEVDAAIAASKPAMTSAFGTADERSRVLRSALSRLDAAFQKLAATPGLKKKTMDEASFVANSRRALIHFQLGNLTPNGGSQLQKALELYTDLEERFPKRLAIGYRRSQTLDALGARSEAISKLRQINEQLDANNEPTPRDHWIRSAVPRLLGVLLWEVAKASGDRGPTTDETKLDLLREAYEFTRVAYDRKVVDNTANADSGEHDKAANNLLYFLLEYLEAGGRSRPDMEVEDVRRLLKEIGGDDPASFRSLDAADTARRAYAFIDDRPAELEAARTVVRLAGTSGTRRSPVVRDAIRAAQRTLELAVRQGGADGGHSAAAALAAPPAQSAGGDGAPTRPARSRKRKRVSGEEPVPKS